jgi:hypothetical protein
MRLINLFTLIVLCVSQVYSMETSAPTADETEGAPYFFQRRIPGAKVPDLKVIESSIDEITKTLAYECIGEVNGSHQRAVYGRFVANGYPFNVDSVNPDLRRSLLITITDGLIYQNEEILNTERTIWALDCHSEFLIFPSDPDKAFSLVGNGMGDGRGGRGRPCHTELSKKDGASLPLACAGGITVKAGKITDIDFSSGHFSPRRLQFALALSYFNEKGVLSGEVSLGGYEGAPSKTVFESLNQALAIASIIELN